MADRAKREIKEPKCFCSEFSAYNPVKKANPQRKDTKLYDIEVTEVDKVNKRLKIHYARYSSRFYEWRPLGEDEGSEYFPFVRKEKPHLLSWPLTQGRIFFSGKLLKYDYLLLCRVFLIDRTLCWWWPRERTDNFLRLSSSFSLSFETV